MTFTLWVKYKRNKRFNRLWTTSDSARADMIAENAAREVIYSDVKVVAYDGYSTETLIYKAHPAG